jgi:flagellar motor switch protein FliN/FliY
VTGADQAVAATGAPEAVGAVVPDETAATAADAAASAAMPAADNAAGRIGVILGIDLPVVVRFGRTEMQIRALARLGPGSVIELGRSPGDPVEMLVSDRIVARGEVVIVGGNYGIRIVDVVSNPFRERRGVRGGGIGQPMGGAR